MSLAGIDPLHDDGYKFGYRLWRLEKDIKIIDNKLLPHGFLNFGIAPLIGKECTKAIDAVSGMISEVIQEN